MSNNFTDACNALKNVVGTANVVTETSILQEYQTATFKTERTILAVVRPETTAEVQECLKIANLYKTPVYPISTGLNSGYGSRVPTADDCIVLELKRMNAIIDFNEELAYVTIEPGVTQQQLYDFLQEKKSSLWMDATGSYTGHSIIGNIAERGFGHTPYGDHFANVGGMEVVLPQGECIHTGFGRFGNAKATGVYRWGVGPYLDGLFTQSNFGIITQLTLWLMPAPDYFQSFYFSVDSHEQLGKVIDLLRPLRLNGTINSAMHIANDYKVLGAIQIYPWDAANGKTPLDKKILHDLGKTWDFGSWNASGALYGSKDEVALARKAIKKQLRGKVKKLRFLDDNLLKFAEIMQKPYQWVTRMNLPEMLKLLKPLYGMTKGVPTDTMIPSVYWRKKELPEQLNPERDNCGLIWLSPIAPTDGQHAMKLWNIIESTFAHYAFEPAVTITLLTERSMDCVIAISYDRDIEGEDERAMACHDELLNKLTSAGYYPYRLGVHAMDKLPEAESPYCKMIASLKTSLDPEEILAPGRYVKISKPNRP